MSSEDTGTLKKLIVRLKCGDKGRIGLKDVVEKLETCLNGHIPESEQQKFKKIVFIVYFMFVLHLH